MLVFPPAKQSGIYIRINIQNLAQIALITLVGCSLLGFSSYALDWSRDEHSAIGILAMKQLQPGARNQLKSLFKPLDARALVKACNWPDEVCETEEWEWSAPQHYINIPRVNMNSSNPGIAPINCV